MAINNLADIYSKKGEDFIKKLLTLQVTIYEKMSGSDFSFEYDSDKGFTFFKRITDLPISTVDRLLMKYYDPAITYFEELSDDVKKNIPVNVRFGFEYFPNTKPNLIKYDNIPKNGLILTYVKDLEKSVVITSYSVLKTYAKQLNVNPPPVLFQGELSEDQQIKLLEYLKKDVNDIKKEYSTKSFTAYLISIVNPDLKKTVLNNDIEKRIEGIIFKFGDDHSKIYAKLIDPIFSELSSKNKNSEKSDLLPIIFMNMIEFMEENKEIWKKYNFSKSDFEDRYIELICLMFNKYIKENKEKLSGLVIPIPQFMKNPEFEMNTFLISNNTTLKYVTSNQSYAELFKIFLALFRKKKKKLADFLSPNLVSFQNEIVDSLIDKLQEGNTLPSFNQFVSMLTECNETDIYEDSMVIEFPTLNESKHLKMMSFWQGAFDYKKTIKESKADTDINIIIGKFQPFNKKHLSSIKEMHQENELKTIIIQVNGTNDKRRPFNKVISKSLLEEVKTSNSDLIEDVKIVTRGELEDLIEVLADKYKLARIYCNEQFQKFIQKQIDYNLFENEYNLGEVVIKSLPKTTDNISISERIVKSIEENDLLEFKKLTPSAIHSYFHVLQTELKKEK